MNVVREPLEAGRHWGLELGRMAALLGVIFIHQSAVVYGADSVFVYLSDQAPRWAVPFFFMLSGYVFTARFSLWADIRYYAPRLLIPFVFWVFVYNVILQWQWGAGGLRSGMIFDFTQPLTYLRLLVYGGYGYHLWFLTGLLSVVVFCAAMVRMFSLRVVLGIAVGLYAVGLVLGSYYPVISGASIFDLWNTRNGPFMGLLFFVLGVCLRKERARAILSDKILLIFGVGVVLLVLEIFML